jgi:RNA polymerase sigma factor (sigma-70 family)
MASAEQWYELRDRARDERSGAATDAFYRLLREEAQLVLRSFRGKLHEAPEDLLHDFLAGKKGWERLLEAEHPKPLFTLAIRRLAIDATRRKKTARQAGMVERPADLPEDLGPALPQPAFDEQLANNERLSNALDQLPERMRLVVILRGRGHSAKEVAECLGISPTNTDKIFSRAKRRLRDLLNETEVEG